MTDEGKPKIRKLAQRVSIRTHNQPNALQVSVFLGQGERVQDLLNDSRKFLPVLYHDDMLMLNKESIVNVKEVNVSETTESLNGEGLSPLMRNVQQYLYGLDIHEVLGVAKSGQSLEVAFNEFNQKMSYISEKLSDFKEIVFFIEVIQFRVAEIYAQQLQQVD